MADNQDIRPIPDPTILTTAASVRLEETLRALIKSEIGHQGDLFNEKLAKVDVRFTLLEDRTAEQKSDTKAALNAALSAQKEAAALQATASEKNIAKVETVLTTSTKALDDKIADLKDRVIAIEATKLGNVEQAVGIRGNMATVISVITAVIAVASIVIAIIVVTRP